MKVKQYRWSTNSWVSSPLLVQLCEVSRPVFKSWSQTTTCNKTAELPTPLPAHHWHTLAWLVQEKEINNLNNDRLAKYQTAWNGLNGVCSELVGRLQFSDILQKYCNKNGRPGTGWDNKRQRKHLISASKQSCHYVNCTVSRKPLQIRTNSSDRISKIACACVCEWKVCVCVLCKNVDV